MTRTLDIAMLGPSGAGKTSLLASLYAQFATVTEHTKLVLSAQDRKTSIELSDYRTSLESIARQLVVTEPGVAGTKDFREHVFSLRDQGQTKGSYLDIRFSDYPGGWLSSPTQAENPQLKRLSEDSRILLVAIDTPALLAEDGRFHHEINQPQLIRDMVSDWVSSKQRRLLLLVPLKCEKWAATRSDALALAGRVREEYKNLLDSASAVADGPAIAITPVQTIGSLVFDGFEISDGKVESRYRGRSAHPRYDPQWTAEPLRHIVRHAITQQQQTRGWWKEFTDFMTGEGHSLRQAMSRLAALDLGPSLEVP